MTSRILILPEKVLSAKRSRRLLFPTPGTINDKQKQRMIQHMMQQISDEYDQYRLY